MRLIMNRRSKPVSLSPREAREGREPESTAIELRSADFSPPRSGPAKTAGSGLKSALLSCRNSLYSMAVLPDPHSSVVGRGNRPRAWWWYQDAPHGHLEKVYENALAHRLR